MPITRRHWLALAGTAVAGSSLAASPEPVIETHVHLFSPDLKRFPRHANGSPVTPAPLEEYLAFARQVGISHAVHVSAEGYQDDLSYLEHTLKQAPRGFLKGTLLLDMTLPDTPRRMAEIAARHPGQIVALRVHDTQAASETPTTTGPIRDRDLRHPQMRKAWQKAGELNIAIQAHIQPWFAADVEKLAKEFPNTRVLVDHFGHAGVDKLVRGDKGWTHTNAEPGYRDPSGFDPILRLARLPQVTLKVSALQYSSREPHPHRDVRPLARKAFDAFGPDRLMVGSLGSTVEAFRAKQEVFDVNFDFLSAADRTKLLSGTAKRVFSF